MPKRTKPRNTVPGLSPSVAVPAAVVGMASAATSLALLALVALGLLPDARPLFIVAVTGATAFMVLELVRTLRGHRVSTGVALATVAATSVVVPLAFDSRSADPFQVVKVTVLGVAALVLLVASAPAMARPRELAARLGPLTWPTAAYAAWTLLAWGTGVDARASTFGLPGSLAGGVLLLAPVAVFVATAIAVRSCDVPAILRIALLAGAGPVTVYALVQLHDRLLTGEWDWVPWSAVVVRGNPLFSTLGNPNHLASYLAAFVPIGVVVAILAATRWMRVLSALIAAAGLVVVVHSASRGAWIGLALGMVVLGLFAAPDVRARPAMVAWAVGGLAATAAAVALLAGAGGLGPKFRDLLVLGARSTLGLRFELWTAAARMVTRRPLTGYGPNAFGLEFPRYETVRYAQTFPTQRVPVDPHNVFVGSAVSLGVPGMLGLLAVLVVAAIVAVRAWRRLRADEVRATPERDVGRRRARAGQAGAPLTGQRARLCIAGTVASIAVLVGQGVFNVQEPVTWFLLWLELGLLASLVRAPDPSGSPPQRAGTPQSRRRGRRRAAVAPAPKPRRSAAAIATTVGLAVAAVPLAVLAPRAYLAERAAFGARLTEAQGVRTGRTSGTRGIELLAAAQRGYVAAGRLNPWEPRYPERAGKIAQTIAGHLARENPASSEPHVAAAAEHFETAASVRPLAAGPLIAHAQLLMEASAYANRGARLEKAVRLARRAQRLRPRFSLPAILAGNALFALGRDAEAIEELTRARTRVPDPGRIDAVIDGASRAHASSVH